MENPIFNRRKTLVFVLRVSFSPWQRIAVWWNRRSAARAEIISPPPSPCPPPSPFVQPATMAVLYGEGANILNLTYFQPFCTDKHSFCKPLKGQCCEVFDLFLYPKTLPGPHGHTNRLKRFSEIFRFRENIWTWGLRIRGHVNFEF